MQQRMDNCYKELCNIYGEDYVFFVFLYGSQNYGLDSPNSDVDTKSVIFLPQPDLILRKQVWTPIPLGDGLCYVTDLFLFLEELTQYVPKALEVFITQCVRVNPKYQFLFDQLLANKEKFLQRNINKGISQFFDLAWEHYRIYSENAKTKELIHAYRNMLTASDLHFGKSVEDSIRSSISDKNKVKEWKKLKQAPKQLIDDFTFLSGIMTNIMDNVGEISSCDLLPEIQEFCLKAYQFQQKNLT